MPAVAIWDAADEHAGPARGRDVTPRLQRVGAGGRLANLHPFGRALRLHASRECEWFVPLMGFGMSDGGCGILADALVAWSAGSLRLRAIVSDARAGRIQHWMASDGAINLDGDGLSSDLDALLRLERLELCPSPRILPAGETPASPSIPRSADASARLAQGLRRTFGPFRASMVAFGS